MSRRRRHVLVASDRAIRPSKPIADTFAKSESLRPGPPPSPATLRRVGVLAADYALDQDDPEAVAVELAELLGLTGEVGPVGCEYCGGVIVRSSLTKDQRYCSRGCAQRAISEARRAAQRGEDLGGET